MHTQKLTHLKFLNPASLTAPLKAISLNPDLCPLAVTSEALESSRNTYKQAAMSAETVLHILGE